ncbi:HAD-IIB family hydrolase [Latilactobacillus graminis]|uniref:Cof-like hydrolase family protein n=2 Tax=Latilactobacillus graminis TaxID=60519 RepID=A0AA89L3C4_9LACO|nr:HAD-IIB family hydrolase [Latilactobacillus graminis]KRM20985.1 cof-like hydrolase family protein [Latilactobacillus graminis DSM 20719]QFP79125.1 HAD-IIB family hydrolase [Latilactobacillus graminis]
MINYIFSNLDGTLLNQDGQLSEKDIAAVKACPLPISLISARSPQAMQPTVDQLSLTTFQVAFNGGLIYQPTDLFPMVLAEAPLVARLVATLQTNFTDISLSAYDLHHWYTQKIDAGIEHAAQNTSQLPTMFNFAEQLQNPFIKIFKVLLILPDTKQCKIVQEFIAQLHLPSISVQQSGTLYLEITSQQATKANALMTILKTTSVSLADCAAFGGDQNDLSMLAAVGHPIVMGNASDQIQAAGQFITKTNQHSGFSYGLKKYITKINQKVG